MNNEQPTIRHYKKSFLLFCHILFGFTLVWFTFLVTDEYLRKEKLWGVVITLIMAILYFLLMTYSAKLFNKERYGLAYFLTIAGFLSTIFLQFITCVNSIPFQMH